MIQQTRKLGRPQVHPTIRFWKLVAKTDSCWNWTGEKLRGGYGRFTIGPEHNHRKPAHRISYEWAKGTIAAGLEIDHLCRNPACVNPDHLEVVTHQENMRRRRNTHCLRGHPMTPENVREGKNGYRACRLCEKERKRERRRGERDAASVN